MQLLVASTRLTYDSCMNDPNDPEATPQEAKEQTLFMHIDGDSESDSILRQVEASGLLNPEQLLLTGDSRYEFISLLGRGGSGEVHRVLDKKLNRIVALKLLRVEMTSNAEMIARFTREAQVIAQLDHPAIIPIYDLGRADSGRWYLTMKEVHGRTLRESIADLHTSQHVSQNVALRQAISALQRVCTAVGFAHGKGVIHRDLKPDNIMIAEFGQVFVLDWGLARILQDPSIPRSSTHPPTDHGYSDHGLIMGTPAFMSPEQARADVVKVGPSSDVWSIGATLFAILYGESPYTGTVDSVLQQVEAGPPEPPYRPDLPLELVELWQACMQVDVNERPPDASVVADALNRFLEGRKNQEKASLLVQEARDLLPNLEQRRIENRKARERAKTALRSLRNSDDLETKELAWKKEDHWRETQADLDQCYDQVFTKVRMAQDHAPQLIEVRSLLADLYYQKAIQAEEEQDVSAFQHYKALVSTYDVGRFNAFLRSQGELQLDWQPRSAMARVYRFGLRARRWAAIPMPEVDLKPNQPHPLTAGRYLIEFREPNRIPIKVPIVIEVDQRWDHRPPGAKNPKVITLPTRTDLARQERFIPGGWFTCGGDSQAMASLPKQRLWVEPFILAARPVSHQEYLVFLNHLSMSSRTQSLEHAPALQDHQGTMMPLYNYDPVSRKWSLPTQVGEIALHPSSPVIGVRWLDAQAYLLWLRSRTDLPWRLPSELEWEMAARGVDGRSFPWGEHVDPAFFCHQDTHLDVLGPPTTGQFPVDCTPYGVLGMAGGVSDWCADTYHPQGPGRSGPVVVRPKPPESKELETHDGASRKTVRGGAWSLPATYGRAASRSGKLANTRADYLGFRLCRDAPSFSSNR